MTALSNSLADLAETIRSSANAFDVARASAAGHAIKAGELLIEAKAACPHGSWAAFLKRAGLADRTAQRWMKLVRAGFNSAMVAELGFAQCEAWAATSARMIPDEGTARLASGVDADRVRRFLAVWFRADGLFRYWSCHLVGERTVANEPRAFSPPWLLGLFHDGLPEHLDVYSERVVPVGEALSLLNDIGAAA